MATGIKIKLISKVLLVIAALLLATNIFLPIWQIELYAPQYPEGLELLIYADSLAGDVEIINGLNHYIGMATLHSENFIEFSILKYIFIFLALCVLAVALIGRKKPVYFLFVGFILFGILAMTDFYRWNYNYGHNLDPNAAIKVPGMSYQPPLIGYKQLLNFGAYSIPDTGGLMLIASGLLILLVVLIESGAIDKIFRRRGKVKTVATALALLMLVACAPSGPKPVALNKDLCAYCKMTITDANFATQLVTEKGRNYVFDDIVCMLGFVDDNADTKVSHFYIADFSRPSDFIDIEQAQLLHSDSLRSPMGGNIAGFAVNDSLELYQARFSGNKVEWVNLIHPQ
jgi:copper chaperone NosL